VNIQDTVFHYHEKTKHHYYRYAASAGYLDWANQPQPFRSYEGVKPVRLSLNEKDPAAAYADLYERSRNQVRPFTPENISLFLALSLGLSAWKTFAESKWALRMNPSSGNLHPTESYLIFPSAGAFPAGVYHYNPYLHAIEPRALGEFSFPAGFLFAFTSIHWREAWKYGERAFRYSNHDIGHAIAAAGFAANLLGWKLAFCGGISDQDVAGMLGFPKTVWEQGEREYPELLCSVYPADAKETPACPDAELVRQVSELSFAGRPNRLSESHRDWPLIPETAEATEKPATVYKTPVYPTEPFYFQEGSGLKAAQIIRQRRSLLACDGVTMISKAVFLTMLDKTLPRRGTAPFDFGLGPVNAHLFLFVHRVKDLVPGLYLFIRNAEDLEILKSACKPDFLWHPVEKGFPLYRLKEGDFKQEATDVSCGQLIAGEGVFSLGMIAKFRGTVTGAPYRYRQLFWETGMIGQVLYLEAEAHGVRATGIGCFFDDPVHDMLGLRDNEFQSLYHFTVGGPVEDVRLQTSDPYHHYEA